MTTTPADDAPHGHPPSPRTRVRRQPGLARYDRATIHAIVDAAMVAHVAVVGEDGQPVVTPTLHWRQGDAVYWHGSTASRAMRAAAGRPVCFTAFVFDGLVLARSAFHHSANYRSVMAYGTAEVVADPEERLAALEHFMERYVPGRWPQVRPPSAQEMKGTMILRLRLDEASAKVSAGMPNDPADDLAVDCWAGVIPARMVFGDPLPDLTPESPAAKAEPPIVAPVWRDGAS